MFRRGKVLSLFMLFALLIALVPAGSASAATWNLAWSDEFDGSSLNTGNWTAEIGTGTGAGAIMNCNTILTVHRI